MIRLALLLSLALMSLCAQADGFRKGFVRLEDKRRIYVEYKAPKSGKPTLVLLNGLTWSTGEWRGFTEAMSEIDPEIGLLLYDMEGQGQTLADRAPVKWEIPIERQIEDLNELLATLPIKGPFSVAGLSYGGAVAFGYAARYPRKFQNVIGIAPFLERLKDQDHYINAYVNTHRVMFPFDPRSDNELYDHYLRIWIYSTYHLSEPQILETPYGQEATYRLVQGAKNFKAVDLRQELPKGKIHLIGGVSDSFVTDANLGAFWKSLSQNRQASYLRILHTEHKIPQLRPELSALWIYNILMGHPDLKSGLTWELDPFEAVARSGRKEIDLKEGKATACESFLRNVLQAK